MLTASLFLLICNVGIVFILLKIGVKFSLTDQPGGRKNHSAPTPLIGGLAVYFTLLLTVFLQNENPTNFNMVILWAGLTVFIGCLDDIKNVHWLFRMWTQIVASLGVIYTTGIQVTHLGFYPIIGSVELGGFGTAFTVFAVVGLLNAFNFIDGIDGLCGSLLLIPILICLLTSHEQLGDGYLYFLVLSGSLIIFLAHNLSSKQKFKMFLGDAGSGGIAFIVAFYIISQINDKNSTLAPPVALWLFLVPICDTVHVMVRRLCQRKSIVQPDLDHLHHRLIKIGFSKIETFMTLLIVALAGVSVGLYLNTGKDIISVFIFIAALIFLPSFLMFFKGSENRPKPGS